MCYELLTNQLLGDKIYLVISPMILADVCMLHIYNLFDRRDSLSLCLCYFNPFALSPPYIVSLQQTYLLERSRYIRCTVHTQSSGHAISDVLCILNLQVTLLSLGLKLLVVFVENTKGSLQLCAVRSTHNKIPPIVV